MQGLTPQGHTAVQNIASRYNISVSAVTSMLQAVNNGGGTMAQFYIPELGGGGQWMQGGMTMVGDMFNYSLKATVNNLCSELANLLATTQVYVPAPRGLSGGGNTWWPSELGMPASSGGQNNTRYAWFPGSRRLAIDVNGAVSVYDTLQHQIGGVQQQQGGNASVTFTSQYGTVDPINLPLISGPGSAPRPLPPSVQQVPQAQMPAKPQTDDVMRSIQQLGDLFNAGVLTQQEFSQKKQELLSRL